MSTCALSPSKHFAFFEQHPDAQQALQAWYRDAKRATWNMPADIKNVYRNASIVGNNRKQATQWTSHGVCRAVPYRQLLSHIDADKVCRSLVAGYTQKR